MSEGSGSNRFYDPLVTKAVRIIIDFDCLWTRCSSNRLCVDMMYILCSIPMYITVLGFNSFLLPAGSWVWCNECYTWHLRYSCGRLIGASDRFRIRMLDFKIHVKNPEFHFTCSKSWRGKNLHLHSPAEIQLVQIKIVTLLSFLNSTKTNNRPH